MKLHEFYAVSDENATPVNEFEIKHLGTRLNKIAIGKRVHNGYDFNYTSESFYTETIADDYDNAFCEVILSTSPLYKVDELLKYHFKYYTKVKKIDKKRFFNHLRYVILPKLQKRENKHKQVYTEYVTKWVDDKETEKSISFNFLELKPSIMGIGVNINEIFNSIFKK